MSALIKQGQAAVLDLALPPARVESEPQREDPTAPLLREIEALTRALEDQDKKHAKALAGARDAGRSEGKAAATRDEAKALAALEAGIQGAAQVAQAKFKSLDQLALLLCETALEKVFAESADLTDLTRRAIRRQMMALRRETILRIWVSPLDFCDEAALHALAALLGANFAVAHDASLAAGACRMDLHLGAIELSVRDHWNALQARLRALAGAGAP